MDARGRRRPHAKRRLDFRGDKRAVLARRDRSRSPRSPGTSVPPQAVQATAKVRKADPVPHATTRQNPNKSPHESPCPWPSINKVYMFHTVKLLPIPGYHESETEFQPCKAFDRPPRNYLSDKPIYPWLPHCQPEKSSQKNA